MYEFNHTGTLQSQFDTAGAGAGNSLGIAATATSVWVVDSSDDELYDFGSAKAIHLWPLTTNARDCSAPQRAVNWLASRTSATGVKGTGVCRLFLPATASRSILSVGDSLTSVACKRTH